MLLTEYVLLHRSAQWAQQSGGLGEILFVDCSGDLCYQAARLIVRYANVQEWQYLLTSDVRLGYCVC